MRSCYAGIDSRETPMEVLSLFRSVAVYLAEQGFTLKSGHAPGADTAFETGCDLAKGNKEIYLPWFNFEGSDSDLIVKDIRAFDMAERYHPRWDKLSNGAKKLQARNTHQVFGKDLESKSKFIICWTRDGKGEGGTGQAIRIAEAYSIPIFDVGLYSDITKARKDLKDFITINNQ